MASNSKFEVTGAVGPSLHWARFSVDGRLVSCSEWLRSRWMEMGLLKIARHARDFFFLSNAESEVFFGAWVAAVKGFTRRVDLRLMGRERQDYSCLFLPEINENGTVASVLVSLSEPQHTQRLAFDESAILGAALKSVSQALAITDEQGKVMWVNHAFCSMLDADPGELIGEVLLRVVDRKASDEDLASFEQNLRNRCSFHQMVKRRESGGLVRSMRIDADLIEEASEPSFVMRCSLVEGMSQDVRTSLTKLEDVRGLFREITGTNSELEKALDAAREEIELARSESEAKTDFLANMSHEIRTPMNAVIGFCDLLLNTRLDDEQAEYVEAIYQSGQLLIKLIGQVLDYSKIESGHLELEDEAFSLEQIMMEVQAIMGTRLRSKELDFHLNCDRLTKQSVRGDATRIKQILINLLGNALKFTRDGYISLSANTFASPHEGCICLSVRIEDTGIGIDAARLQSLFNPFAQANSRISKDYGGTGLGLAICKRLCEAMKGDIWVESTSRAKGTVFVFEIHLPVSESQESKRNTTTSMMERIDKMPTVGSTAQENESSSSGKSDRGKLNVLVVDDNPNNLLITSKLSEHLGYRATTVNSGVEAINRMKEHRFDIVLMDVRMAPINGMETTRMIRDGEAGEDRSDAYIIAVTAHALQGDKERCIESGMNDYLSKPLTLDRLEESLNKARSRISLD